LSLLQMNRADQMKLYGFLLVGHSRLTFSKLLVVLIERGRLTLGQVDYVCLLEPDNSSYRAS
jgi:hypothetical protein